METDVKASKRVQHEKLVRFVRKAFEKLGVPDTDAQVGAEALVAADLRGVDTHGVIRFSPQAWYVKWLAEGSMTARPNIRIVTESASTALIDGDRGMGMVVGRRAMQLAIQKAKQTGIGMVGVRNSRHYGMSAYYAMQALAHDMIGIAMTNASRQVVPTFGREREIWHQSDLLCRAGGSRAPVCVGHGDDHGGGRQARARRAARKIYSSRLGSG